MNSVDIEAVPPERAADAIAVHDAHRMGRDRTEYLIERARQGGLLVAYKPGAAMGFVCLEAAGFFGRSFVSLLVVGQEHRRCGVASALLAAAEQKATRPRLFTSTNQSNAAMITLLRKRGYVACGWVYGIDENDPELFYYKELAQ